ncbi:MAG TPA: allophanate hydrolase [Alphaproteobacteria bacterium]|nr:allophanate hydrolase [Alphaproteobacteria bacterium]
MSGSPITARPKHAERPAGQAPTMGALAARYGQGARPSEVVDEVLRRIAAWGDDRIWIGRVPEAALRARAGALDRVQREGGAARLPLFGIPFAVKDNIDVAGLPTTAGCPDFAYVPEMSATAARRLEAAGAILVGKTNLDQFATGLVGVRSPYGAPRNPFDPAYIPGGSSSGSAVAVAAGLVAFALGTDTAGSGRVPAGFNNVVGLKPSIGLVSAAGVVPACRSLDCVSIFALTVEDGLRALRALAGPDDADPFSRAAPAGFALDAAFVPRVFDFAVPRAADLRFFGNADYERLFEAAVARLEAVGGRRHDIDFAPFAQAAEILYSDAGVAERVAAVGDFIRDKPDSVLPVTRAIIERGRGASAAEVYRARERLAALRAQALAAIADVDALVVPTAGTIYRADEVARDPIALNGNLGVYTNFVNPMDMAALAVPSGFTDAGLPFGISLIAPAFHEPMLAGIARAFERAAALPLGATGARAEAHSAPAASHAAGCPSYDVAVFGAHMSGEPLNGALRASGARLLGACRTAARYRLYDLGGAPARPGLVRAETGGGAIAGELWRLSAAAFAQLTVSVKPPLAIGPVELDDGSSVAGFVCDAGAVGAARDITRFGGWRAARAAG